MKLGLSLLAIYLFCSNYQLCELFYSNDIEKWWGLKQNIYNIIIALCFYITTINTKGALKFVLEIGIGLCISNCIDRLFYDIKSFNKEDIYMIIITVLLAYYDTFIRKENATKATSIYKN